MCINDSVEKRSTMVLFDLIPACSFCSAHRHCLCSQEIHSCAIHLADRFGRCFLPDKTAGGDTCRFLLTIKIGEASNGFLICSPLILPEPDSSSEKYNSSLKESLSALKSQRDRLLQLSLLVASNKLMICTLNYMFWVQKETE